MGSKAGEEIVVKMEESDEKTQIKFDPEMSNYEPNSNFSGVSSKKFETLPSPSFSKLLEGVVLAANSSNPSPQPAVPFQGQFVMSHQEALGTVTAIAAHALRQTKPQDESVKSLSKLPISQSETVSSNPSVVAQETVSSLPDKSHVEKETAKIISTQESEHKSSDQQFPDSQSGSAARVSLAAFPSAQEKVVKHDSDATPSDVPKTPKSDGYSWRKYGQKQIKSSGSSRSYFRCTNLSCSAKKKVQHLDGSGEILDVVYKGNHNHDPPPYVIKGFSRKKVFSDSSAAKLDDPCTPKCSVEPKPALQWTSECQDKHLNSSVCTLKTDVKEHDIKIPTTTIRLEGESSTMPVKVEHHRTNSSNGIALTATMNERDIPIKKRRIKESGKECSESVYRTFKEPKVVLPGDLGISSDGYRWRKYGQKMVKGNSHPRSYYRCSTAGCPVRKHVERATDGSSSIIAMYEGEHDHDKPVPKKQHSWAKSPFPVNPQTNTINNVPLIKSEEKERAPSPGQVASPAQQCEGPNNNSGEQNTTPNPGPEKVLEAAQARPTIGIELKSC